MEAPPRKNHFVNVLAWSSIVIFAPGVLFFLLQVVLSFLMHDQINEQLLLLINQSQEIPAFLRFFLEHYLLLMCVSLLVMSIALAASIGLLLRKNWARITFIALCVLAIVEILAVMVFQHFFFAELSTSPTAPEHMDLFVTFMEIFSVVLHLVLIALTAWIIKKLVSPTIKQEFIQSP